MVILGNLGWLSSDTVPLIDEKSRNDRRTKVEWMTRRAETTDGLERNRQVRNRREEQDTDKETRKSTWNLTPPYIRIA